MNKLTPLKSKNGESEWPYKWTTLIAKLEKKAGSACDRCFFKRKPCSLFTITVIDCKKDFDKYVYFIEKPATK